MFSIKQFNVISLTSYVSSGRGTGKLGTLKRDKDIEFWDSVSN
jgi:hypothetical protein